MNKTFGINIANINIFEIQEKYITNSHPSKSPTNPFKLSYGNSHYLTLNKLMLSDKNSQDL